MLPYTSLSASEPESDRPARLASALEAAAAGALLIVLAALSGAVFAGCDSDGLGLGDFRADVQLNGAEAALEGEAVYTVVDGPAGPRVVIGLFNGDLFDNQFDGYNFVALRRDGALPGVGAYAVTVEGAGRTAFTGSYARVDDADDPDEARGPVLRATDGTVTVTRVDEFGFLSGTFQFTGTGIRVESPRTRVLGEVSGTFEARYERPETLRRLGVDLGLDG